MRITGGIARGIAIKAPPGEAVRPATDRMRKALFSSLGDVLRGARVLDLFAGTGAYGLEALSRGAGRVVWVEKDRRALQALAVNLAAVQRSLGGGGLATTSVVGTDVLQWSPGDEVFDLILLDPPYDLAPRMGTRLLAQIVPWLSPEDGVRIAFEHGGGEPEWEPPPGWSLVRRLGKDRRDAPVVSLYGRESAPEVPPEA